MAIDVVLKRANNICEGCGKSRAVQAHHMSYENLGNEFLWELKAVCVPCHERWHAGKQTMLAMRTALGAASVLQALTSNGKAT